MTKPLVGPGAWSASSVNRFESCLQAFYFQYVAKVPRPAADIPIHWRVGTVAHFAMEQVARRVKTQRLSGPWMTEENWEVAKAAITASWAKEEMPDPVDSDGQWDRVHTMIEATLNDLAINHEHIVAPEQKVYYRGDGAAIIGFIDLLLRPEEGVAEILDYKSRSTPAKAEDLALDFQGRLYAALVRRLYPWVERVVFSHYYPPIATKVPVEIPEEASEAAYWRLLAVKDMAQHISEWTPNPGSQCSNCAYQPMCPAWAEPAKPEPVAEPTPGTVKAAAAENEGLF